MINRRRMLSQVALGSFFLGSNHLFSPEAHGEFFSLSNPGLKALSQPNSLKILFGSCLNARKNTRVLAAVQENPKDALLLLGDNIYAQSNSPRSVEEQYALLGANPLFQSIRAQTPILATWDDHDFGKDNGDGSYINKDHSREQFLQFFRGPQALPSVFDPAIYSSQTIENTSGLKAHTILLDTRWHRDDSKGILLGKTQWEWLENELKTPADLILLCSSIQVLSSKHRFESWGKVPQERDRLFDLLKQQTTPTLILSGDRHFHELTRGDDWGLPRIHEFTSSGFNMGAPFFSEVESSNPGRVWSHLGSGFGTLDLSLVSSNSDNSSPAAQQALKLTCSVLSPDNSVVKTTDILY